MSSVDSFKEFVNERLTTAAEEIFGVFIKTIVEYEEEIDRQRRLLDIVWKPELQLHRIELPQQHVCEEEEEEEEEEVPVDQQLCIQEKNSSLDQEDPEPPQVKEELEELSTSQEGEQLVVKQETPTYAESDYSEDQTTYITPDDALIAAETESVFRTFMFTPTYELSDHCEDGTLFFNPDKSQSAAETELPDSMCISGLKEESNCETIRTKVSEPNTDHQLLSRLSHEAENQDQKRTNHDNSGSTRNAEQELSKRLHDSKSHDNNVFNQTMSKSSCRTLEGKKSFQCEICEKAYMRKYHLQKHLMKHTGNKPHLSFGTFKCGICGKVFNSLSVLNSHLRTHSGEKPYFCNTCGKSYSHKSTLIVHIRVHTGEKPYSCNTCGKRFSHAGKLNIHIRGHTGEKPFLCTTCGKSFRRKDELNSHLRRIHTEKPYQCEICGKRYVDTPALKSHMRNHKGEKAFSQKTWKRFQEQSR
ncbi:zinc finger protein 879-like [Centropristis striata]|uniref:zinc finger protein 879-like n=1 Tax=Centropristis striata TaxID=184440 RepID=UPI0027E182F2|nr:zinc finger protein 879-like [Centropristis striata]